MPLVGDGTGVGVLIGEAVIVAVGEGVLVGVPVGVGVGGVLHSGGYGAAQGTRSLSAQSTAYSVEHVRQSTTLETVPASPAQLAPPGSVTAGHSRGPP
jgi:hypothetical protein